MKNEQIKKIGLITTLSAAALTGGCADTPYLDSQIGKSVDHLVSAQTYDPAAQANPPALAPEVGDGPRLKNAIDAHRKAVTKGKEEVGRRIDFEAGE
jgi:hypothetical protein